MDSRRQWTVVLFVFVMGDGIVTQLRGALLSNFQRSFEVSEQLLGFVAPAGTVGLVGAVLVVGMLSGRLDARRVILVGAAGTAVVLALVSVADSYAVLLALFLVQGGAVGVVRALDRPLLGHLFPDRRGQLFNLYALVWALGATAGPLLANAVLAVGEWRLTYPLVATLFLAVALVVSQLDAPEVTRAEQSLSWPALRAVLRRPSIRGMAVALVFSGGVEGIVFTWLPFYAAGFVGEARANLLLSAFLVMYIPGRFGYSLLVDRLRPLDLVVVLALLSLPTAALAVIVGSTVGLVGGVLTLGLVVAGFFPTLSAFGIEATPQYSGPVNAIATAANFLGLSAGPVVVGVLAGSYGIERGMQVLLPILGCFVVVVALTRRRLRDRARTGHGAA